jgi:hypothetical protein
LDVFGSSRPGAPFGGSDPGAGVTSKPVEAASCGGGPTIRGNSWVFGRPVRAARRFSSDIDQKTPLIVMKIGASLVAVVWIRRHNSWLDCWLRIFYIKA